MKKLLLLLPLMFIGCTSIRYVTTDHGTILDDQKRPLNIVGSPRMTCINSQDQIIADGFFVRVTEDGSFLIDEYGSKYVLVKDPVCQLARDTDGTFDNEEN